MRLLPADATSCGSIGDSGIAAFKEDGSDLSATFTCPAGQSVLPSVDKQVAATGNHCAWDVPLNQIADGATLTESKTATGANSYKLSLGSLPAEPRLFCFACVNSSTGPSGGPRAPPCNIYLYAPPAKKGTDDRKTVPQDPQKPQDPKDGKGPTDGKIPDPIVDVVTPDKTKTPNSGYSLTARWSTSLALVSLFFGAAGVGSVTYM